MNDLSIFSLALCSALLGGCSSKDNATPGPTAGSTSIIYESTAGLSGFEIIVGTAENACALRQASNSHPANSSYFLVYWKNPVTTGTYAWDAAYTHYSVEHHHRDAACASFGKEVATGGTLTISAYDPRGSVTGSFTADFPSGSVTESFTASFCDSSVNTGPSTCN